MLFCKVVEVLQNGQTRMVWLPDSEKNFQDIFDMIHERDSRRTDRQTDQHTDTA